MADFGKAAFDAASKNAKQISDLSQSKAEKLYVDTELAKKTTSTYVDQQISNIGNASPKGTYATLSDLQTAFPTGATGIYVVTADGKWYYWNGTAWTAGGVYQATGIGDTSIKIPKLESAIQGDLYTTSSKNLLNPYKLQSGYIDCLNVFNNSTSLFYTEKIAVNAGESFFFTNDGVDVQARFITPLKADGTPIATTNTQFTYLVNYTIPANVTHLIVSYNPVTYPKFAISKTSPLRTYEPYYVVKTVGINKEIDSIKSGIGTINSQLFETSTKNLYNPSNTKSGYVDCLNAVVGSSTLVYTEKIPVSAGEAVFFTDNGADAQARFLTPLKADGTSIATSDAQYVFLNNYVVPANVTHLIVSFSPTTYPKFAISKGSPLRAYEPYLISKIDKVNTSASNYYKDKIMLTYGDSITGQEKWQPYVSTTLRLSSYINRGVGGRLVSGNSGMNADTQIATLPTAAEFDFLTFMGGTNDWAQSVPLGSVNDTTNSTFYGSLNILAQKLMNLYPKKRIIFMTTPCGTLYGSSTFTDGGYVNTLGLTTRDYSKCVREVAEKFGFPCVDIYSNAGWNRYNITNYITDDGAYLHPNDAGGKRIAEVLIGKLKSIEPLV